MRKVEVVKVTPTMAEEFLRKNTSNRPIRERHVKFLLSQMKRHKWELSTDAVGFDKKGKLINGQHRLTAIVKYGKAVDLLIARGLESEAFNVIDTGKLRNAGDIMGVAGITAAHHKAAICRAVMNFKRTGIFIGAKNARADQQTGNQDILDFAEKHRSKLEESYEVQYKVSSEFAALKGRQIAALYWVLSDIDRDEALTFFNYITTGLGLKHDDPIYVLRKKLINEAAAKKKYPEIDKMAWVILAWNHTRKGSKITKLQWSGNSENFPKPN